MITKFFVDANGAYIGGFSGAEPPTGSIEVPEPPMDARQIWNGASWDAFVAPPPDRVSARQFELQLIDDGLIDQVEAWISTQDRKTQSAFRRSGEFVRTEPMMQAGFAALGYSTEQVDEFFHKAVGL